MDFNLKTKNTYLHTSQLSIPLSTCNSLDSWFTGTFSASCLLSCEFWQSFRRTKSICGHCKRFDAFENAFNISKLIRFENSNWGTSQRSEFWLFIWQTASQSANNFYPQLHAHQKEKHTRECVFVCCCWDIMWRLFFLDCRLWRHSNYASIEQTFRCPISIPYIRNEMKLPKIAAQNSALLVSKWAQKMEWQKTQTVSRNLDRIFEKWNVFFLFCPWTFLFGPQHSHSNFGIFFCKSCSSKWLSVQKLYVICFLFFDFSFFIVVDHYEIDKDILWPTFWWQNKQERNKTYVERMSPHSFCSHTHMHLWR